MIVPRTRDFGRRGLAQDFEVKVNPRARRVAGLPESLDELKARGKDTDSPGCAV